MAANNIVVRNEKHSDKVDSSDATKVRPSDWNANLVITLTGLFKAIDAIAPSVGSLLRVTGTESVEQLVLTDYAASVLAAADDIVARGILGAAAIDSAALTGTPTAPTPVTSDTSTRIATMAAVHAVLSALNAASLNSPAFTGIPTAPTAALGTNTTQLATMAALKAAIDALLAGAPGALDTLNELSAALGNDANYAATLTSALALKAALASPTFTGVPAAPTAAPGTNTTQLATMAALQAGLASISVAPKLFHVRDEKTSGTASGTFTAGSRQTHVLNTVLTNEITGASLSSNQLTLPAGTYEAEAWSNAYQAGSHTIILRNVTDSADLVVGSAQRATASIAMGSLSVLDGRFTLAATKTVSLQAQCDTTGLYGAANAIAGLPEIYADVQIRKVA